MSDCEIQLWISTNGQQLNSNMAGTTNTNGSFIISGDTDGFPKCTCFLFLKILKNSTLIKETELIESTSALDRVLNLLIELLPAAGSGNMHVFGRVTDASGTPQPSLKVIAFDKSLSTITQLEFTHTVDSGEYQISFTYPPSGVAKTTTDLIIKVEDPNDSSKFLVESPLFLSAQTEIEINLCVEDNYYGKTSFARAVEKLIGDDEINDALFNLGKSATETLDSIENLSSGDITYIANKCSLQPEILSRILNSKYINLKLEISENHSVEMLFGALSYIEVDTVDELFFSRVDAIDKAIEQAGINNDITCFSTEDRLAYVALVKTGLINYLSSVDSQSDLSVIFYNSGITDDRGKQIILTSLSNFLEKSRQDMIGQDLIEDIRENEDNEFLNSDMVDKFEFSMQAIHLTGNPLLVNCFFLNDPPVSSIDSLIALDGTELASIIQGKSIELPTDTNTSEEYAEQILTNLGRIYPEKVISRAFANDNNWTSQVLHRFFDDYPGIPFLSDTIENIWSNYVDPNYASTAEESAIINNLKILQKLCNLTYPEKRYEAIKVLWDLDFTSAENIVKAGEDLFIEQFSSSFQDHDAGIQMGKYIYRIATLQSIISLNTWMNFGGNVNSVNPSVLSPSYNHSPGDLSGVPSLSQLFGSTGCYRCPSDRSVFSAAAYLADLLQFNIDNTSIHLSNEFTKRRGDVMDLKLDRRNTINRIPYIDIVNELLGSVVAELDVNSVPKTYNTTEEEDSLRAFPEHLDKISDAMEILRTTSYPWKLPFDYWLEEGREWYKKMEVPKYHIMESFPYIAGIPQAPTIVNAGDATTYLDHSVQLNPCGHYNETNIAKEYLKISETDYSEIFANFTDPNDLDTIKAKYNFLGTLADLMKLGEFMKVSGLTYDEICEYFQSYYVNPVESETLRLSVHLGIKELPPDNIVVEDSDLANAFMSYDNAYIEDMALIVRFLDRLYRFARLRRCTGLSVRDLDLIIFGFKYSSETWDEAFLVLFYRIIRLRDEYDLDLEEALVWYSDFNTNQYYDPQTQKKIVNLYDELFRNQAFSQSEDSKTFDPTLPDDSKKSLDSLSINEIVYSALNINEEGYQFILAKERLMWTSSGSLTVDTATVKNLSKVFRVVSFCRTFGLTFNQFYLLTYLANDLHPINWDNVEPIVPDTRKYLDVWNAIKASPFALEDLRFLFTRKWDTSCAIIPSPDKIIESYKSLGIKLNTEIDRLMKFAGLDLDYQREIVQKNLAFVFPESNPQSIEDRNTVLSFIERTQTIPTSNNAVVEAFSNPSEFTGIEKINERYTRAINIWNYSVDPKKTAALKEQLSKFVPKEKLDKAVTLVVDTWPAPNQEYAAIIENYFSIFTDAEIAKDRLSNGSGGSKISVKNERCNFVLGEIGYYLLKQLLIHEVSVIAGVSADHASGMLTRWVHVKIGNDQVLSGDLWTNIDFIRLFQATDFEPQSDELEALKYILKASVFINKYNLSIQACEFIKNHNQEDIPSGFNILNIFNLPPTDEVSNELNEIAIENEENFHTPSQIETRLHFWYNLNKAVLLEKYYAKPLHSLYKVWEKTFEADATPSSICNELSCATGWNYSDILYLQITGEQFEEPEDFKNVIWIEELANRIALSKKLGASPYSIVKRNNERLLFDDVIAIRGMARGTQSRKLWFKSAQVIMDPLRIKLRDALVEYLLCYGYSNTATNRCDFNNTDELYDHFLIDTQMNPCALTSRIVQATLTIQLFIQRIQLNLEISYADPNNPTPLMLTEAQAKKWEWYKHYRVWEACRKIFLYPENWLEPDLRINCSETFTELIDFLNQNDVTNNVAENAFHFYFERMEALSSLEIAGIYREDINDEKEDVQRFITHYIGRTRSFPHTYYYRRFDNLSWTPWEKIDVEIDAEQVTPVVWNNIIYLFWPILTDTKMDIIKDDITRDAFNEYKEITEQVTEEDFNKAVAIRLAYTRRLNSKWQPKKISKNYHKLNHSLIVFADAQQNNAIRYADPYEGEKSIAINLSKVTNNQIELALIIHHHHNKQGAHSQAKIIFDKEHEITIKSPVIKSISDNTIVGYHFYQSYGSLENNQLLLNDTPSLSVIYSPDSTLQTTHLFNNLPNARISMGNTLFYYDLNSGPFEFSWNKMMPISFKPDMDAYKEPPQPNDTFTWYGIPELMVKFPMTYSILARTINSSWGSLNQTSFYADFQQQSRDQTGVYDVSLSKRVIVNQFNPLFNKQSFIRNNNSVVENQYKSESSLGTELYKFYPLDHVFIRLLRNQINKTNGITDLFNPNNDLPDLFRQKVSIVIGNLLLSNNFGASERACFYKYKAEIDFDKNFPNAIYNWELFFHVPLLIANKLASNQQFSDAQKWYHFIFDPTFKGETDDLAEKRPWKFKPFYDIQGVSDIRELMYNLNSLHPEIVAWENNPADPHMVAEIRLYSYMKNVVMKYLDNLIAWGDYLFAQETLESLNEATQLYMLAHEILGPRPLPVDPTYPEGASYNQLLQIGSLDEFSNQLSIIETYYGIPMNSIQNEELISDVRALEAIKNQFGAFPTKTGESNFIPTYVSGLYFGIPFNENLMSYWDKVENRLFLLRNSMNLQGIQRQLPLFAPPIDPDLLVKAAAAGLDITQVMNNQAMPQSPYRFRILLQKAKELAGEVISLGASLLSALEKKDSESLTLAKAVHEKTLLKAINTLKHQAISEAQSTLDSLQESLDNAQMKKAYYLSRQYINEKEKEHLKKMGVANNYQLVTQGTIALGAILGAIPQFNVGVPPGTQFGGIHLGNIQSAASSVIGIKSTVAQYEATVASICGGYDRRKDDWVFQGQQSEGEIKSLSKQLAGAKIKLAMAEKDAENHSMQVDQSEECYDYLKTKFTNDKLYDWLVKNLSSVYFQAYRLSVQIARQAEKAYQFELSPGQVESIISFGQWDSLRQGLVAGERLRNELNLLEKAYMDANTRDNEITRHISLAVLNPSALNDLKINGKCEFDIPEMLYDFDFPGQYLRRIKSVAVTIPAVTGPYTNVSCKLNLLTSRYRHDPTCTGTAEDYKMKEEDPRFTLDPIGIQSIAISNGQNDRGLFEFNFNDERYLPFEGAGTISRWQIELPDPYRQFDYQTISDFILHVSYSAKDAGGELKNGCLANIEDYIADFFNNPDSMLGLAFDWKAQFADELFQISDNNGDHQTAFQITRQHFPFFIQDYLRTSDKNLKIKSFRFFTKGENIPNPEYILTIDSSQPVELSQTQMNPSSLSIYMAGHDCDKSLDETLAISL